MTAVFLLIGSIGGWLSREEILLAAALIGACLFQKVTANALLPQIVSRHVLPRAVSMSTTAIQTALILRPSIGGLLLGFGASLVYFVAAVALMLSALFTYIVKVKQVRNQKGATVSLRSFFSGLEYVGVNRLSSGPFHWIFLLSYLVVQQR